MSDFKVAHKTCIVCLRGSLLIFSTTPSLKDSYRAAMYFLSQNYPSSHHRIHFYNMLHNYMVFSGLLLGDNVNLSS